MKILVIVLAAVAALFAISIVFIIGLFTLAKVSHPEPVMDVQVIHEIPVQEAPVVSDEIDDQLVPAAPADTGVIENETAPPEQ